MSPQQKSDSQRHDVLCKHKGIGILLVQVAALEAEMQAFQSCASLAPSSWAVWTFCSLPQGGKEAETLKGLRLTFEG